MATNLYEALGIGHSATTDEIRRAYKKKALETHPDRLRQGASAAEKSVSEDLFRKVNNAYEVLHDPQSRALYDKYGVWPPPMPTPQGSSANGPHNAFSAPFSRDPSFNDPFFRGPRTDPFVGGFGFGPGPSPRDFTDPFVLFNSIFGDLSRTFQSDPFFDDRSFGHRGSGSNHFGGGFFNSAFPSMLPSPLDFGGGGMGSSRMQTFSAGGNGGRWVSQSWTSSTVNGVTHTKGVRRDSSGNEHVIYQYPDGTERRTVNGMEQSTSQSVRALPPPPPAPHISGPTRSETMPPPYYEGVAQPVSRSRSSRHHGHHGHYYDHSDDRHEERDGHGHKHGRDRGKEYEADRHSGHGHHDDRYGHDAHNNSSWKFWRS